MSNNTLTERQQEILDFIIQDIDTHGFPPTIPEIQKEFSFKSPTAANDHLEALARKGCIIRHHGKSRGIEVNNYRNKNQKNDNNTMEIPVVGRIAAGTPILAQENIEDTIFVDRAFVKISNGEMHGIFALRIKGDSMKDVGIFDGDFVIIEKRAYVNNGEIAAVLLDDEATLKRVFKEKGKIRLQPENDKMEPIFVSPNEKNISIIGKLRTVIRNI